ncbi:MAG TPA: hypothetical protein VFG30_25240 [Polyangiales bacterium]|nr:hypothetical protein [Polyangiales bacterium]
MSKLVACVKFSRSSLEWVRTLPGASCCALILLVACMSSPRSSSEIAQKTDPVTFSGVFEAPGVDLELQAKNQKTGAWVRFGTARTREADPVISASGSPYFRYQTNAVLPQSPAYWLPHAKSGRIEAQVRVVHGDRVLRAFAADAESCARQKHDVGMSEREVFEACSAKEPELARVFVAACGGVGEPCCPVQAAKQSSTACAAAYSCEASLCVEPPYPVPMLRDYQVDLSIPAGHRLRDAWLVLDDRPAGADSERPLVRDHRTEIGVRISEPHSGIARLTFDLGYYKPGVNRFKVRAVAGKGEARRAIDGGWFKLEYDLPRALGFSQPGRFELPPDHFPRRMSDCHGSFCKDADRDGLNDLWENVAVQQLRPRLLLDRSDGLFASRTDLVRVLTSVTPMVRGRIEYVLFASVVAFSRDYGHLGMFDHPGDAEAFGMLYRIDADGGLNWVASAAKGHPCLTCRSRYAFFPQDFAEDGTPLVYVERQKHGLWQNGQQCRARAAFSCKGDASMRPPAFNVGDPSPDGSRGLIDEFDAIAAGGAFGQLAGVFPGDAVWTATLARVPGKFCGGGRDCGPGRSATQPGTIIGKMVQLFETARF